MVGKQRDDTQSVSVNELLRSAEEFLSRLKMKEHMNREHTTATKTCSICNKVAFSFVDSRLSVRPSSRFSSVVVPLTCNLASPRLSLSSGKKYFSPSQYGLVFPIIVRPSAVRRSSPRFLVRNVVSKLDVGVAARHNARHSVTRVFLSSWQNFKQVYSLEYHMDIVHSDLPNPFADGKRVLPFFKRSR